MSAASLPTNFKGGPIGASFLVTALTITSYARKMLMLLLFVFGLQLVASASAVTECTNKSFESFDPHQIYDLADHRLGWKVYLPLVGSSRGPGLAKNFSTTDRKTWMLELRDDVKFRETTFWKPGRPVMAPDVVASLMRQLSKEGELTPYHYAKFSGLVKRLRSVSVLGPRQVQLTFSSAVSEPEFIGIFSSPASIVAPADFLEKLPDAWTHFPPTQDVQVEVRSGAVELNFGGEKAEIIRPLDGMPAARIPEVCDVLINPTPEQEKVLKSAGVSYRTDLRGHTRVYLYLSQPTPKPLEVRDHLRAKVEELGQWHEGYLPLRGYVIQERSIEKKIQTKASPLVRFSGKILNVCQPSNVDPSLVGRIVDLVRGSTDRPIEVENRLCQELLETDRRFPGSLGSLVAFQHRNTPSGESHMPCHDLAFPDFFCSDSSDPKVISGDMERFGRLVPLFAVERKILILKKPTP